MKTQFTVILNELFKASGKTYKDIDTDLGYSETTVRRWLNGKTEPTISTFYKVVEYLGGNKKDVQARIGMAALEEWESTGYKNARELMEDFAVERARLHEAHQLEKKIMRESHEESKRLMREEHAAQIEKLKALRLELQEQFQQNTNLLTDRYNANSKFLTEHAAKIERLNDQLTERAAKAEEIAQAAQARAARAEKRIDDLDKRRHHVFLGMLLVIIILIGIIIASFILNLPAIGWGNL